MEGLSFKHQNLTNEKLTFYNYLLWNNNSKMQKHIIWELCTLKFKPQCMLGRLVESPKIRGF